MAVNVPYYIKSIFAGVTTCLAQIGAILVGDTTFGDITQGQWVFIALATILAAGGVYGLQLAPANISTSVRD